MIRRQALVGGLSEEQLQTQDELQAQYCITCIVHDPNQVIPPEYLKTVSRRRDQDQSNDPNPPNPPNPMIVSGDSTAIMPGWQRNLNMDSTPSVIPCVLFGTDRGMAI